MYTVYGDMLSGNCYKVKLLLVHLDLPHAWVPVDVLSGATRAPEFLRRNPNGKIPVLALASGEHLWESNAILNYLAEGTAYLPRDPLRRARVLQWQFFEQYSHEPYIAVARFIARYLGMPADRIAEYKSKQAGGYRALDVMEQALATSQFLPGPDLSIADISLYAYTHVADEGGFSLDNYPAIRRWLAAVASHPRHVRMTDEG